MRHNTTGDGVLLEFGFAPERFPLDVAMLLILGGAFTALTFIILLASGSSRAEMLSLRMTRHRQRLLALVTALCGKVGTLRSSSSNQPITTPAGGERRPLQTAIEIDLVSEQSDPRLGGSHTHHENNSQHSTDSLHRGVVLASAPMHQAGVQQGAGGGAWFPPGKAGAAKRTVVGGQQPTVTISLLSEEQQPQPTPQGKQEPMVLSWENLSCRVKQSFGGGGYRYILQSVSGLAGPQSTQTSSPSDTDLHAHPPTAAAADADDHLSISAQNGHPREATTAAVQRGGVCSDTGSLSSVSSSCLFAILGPSGAGKTTLLDILAGRKAGNGVTGEVRINGHRMDARGLRKVGNTFFAAHRAHGALISQSASLRTIQLIPTPEQNPGAAYRTLWPHVRVHHHRHLQCALGCLRDCFKTSGRFPQSCLSFH